MERKPVLKALVGSHNYNLQTKNSDKDYLLFVLPSLEDLYKGNFFTKSYTSKSVDYSVQDVRNLPKLLFKSNPTFLELLFSKEFEGLSELNFLFERKEEFAKLNLEKLFNSGMGTSKSYQKKYKKSVEDGKPSGKYLMHSLRMLYLLRDYLVLGKTFEQSLRPAQNSYVYLVLKSASESEGVDSDFYQEEVRYLENKLFEWKKSKGHELKPNKELFDELESRVRDLVFKKLFL